MIKAETLKKLETSLGLKEGDFKTLYEDKDEKDLPLDTFEIIPKTEYDTRITNIKKEAGTAALEIAVKEARKKYSLEFEGKTFDKFAESLSAKVLSDAKIEPDKKVRQLETDLGVMKNNFETEKKTREKIEGEYKQKETSRTINSNVISLLPKKTIIPLEKVAKLALEDAQSNGISVELSDTGAVIFKKGDEILKDKNLVPLKADEVLKPFYDPYVTPASGGDGGGDNAGQNKPGSFAAFAGEMNEKGIKEGSKAFNDEMQSRITNKTLTV